MRMLSQRSHHQSAPGPRLWRRRKAKTKAMRVSAISTDQLVPCPTCADPMKLAGMQTFECKRCDRALTAEQVFDTLLSDAK